MSSDSQAVLDFWFEALTPAQWFKKDPDMDRMILQRFGALHTQASQCECYPENGRRATGRDHCAGPVLAQYLPR